MRRQRVWRVVVQEAVASLETGGAPGLRRTPLPDRIQRAFNSRGVDIPGFLSRSIFQHTHSYPGPIDADSGRFSAYAWTAHIWSRLGCVPGAQVKAITKTKLTGLAALLPNWTRHGVKRSVTSRGRVVDGDAWAG